MEIKPDDKEVITGERCIFCGTDNLTLMEAVVDIPYFGVTHIFTMNCGNCGYKKSDVESEEDREPAKYELEVESEDDLKIRVIKSAEATVKIPYVGEIEPGEAANGYVTNVEGIINRFKDMIEGMKEEADDKSDQKKAKNLLKKLNRVLWGREKIKIQIDDPTGNSAIISEKAKKN